MGQLNYGNGGNTIVISIDNSFSLHKGLRDIRYSRESKSNYLKISDFDADSYHTWHRSSFYVDSKGKFKCRRGHTNATGCLSINGEDEYFRNKHLLYRKNRSEGMARFSTVLKWA